MMRMTINDNDNDNDNVDDFDMLKKNLHNEKEKNVQQQRTKGLLRDLLSQELEIEQSIDEIDILKSLLPSNGLYIRLAESNREVREALSEFRCQYKHAKLVILELEDVAIQRKYLSKLKQQHKLEHRRLQKRLKDMVIKVKRESEKRFSETGRSTLLELELKNPKSLNDEKNTIRQRDLPSQCSNIQMARQLTDTLSHAKKLLSTEVMSSTEILTLLGNSSSTVKQTTKQQIQLSSTARIAKGLISRIKRRDRTDKIIMALALLFFVLVVLYVIKSRTKLPSLPFTARTLQTSPSNDMT